MLQSADDRNLQLSMFFRTGEENKLACRFHLFARFRRAVGKNATLEKRKFHKFHQDCLAARDGDHGATKR